MATPGKDGDGSDPTDAGSAKRDDHSGCPLNGLFVIFGVRDPLQTSLWRDAIRDAEAAPEGLISLFCKRFSDSQMPYLSEPVVSTSLVGSLIMDNFRSYRSKVDDALNFLSMAEVMLRCVIPENEHEKCRSLATELVAKLLILTFETLGCPSESLHHAASSSVHDELLSKSPLKWSFQTLIDSVDVDSQIERHFKRLLQARWTANELYLEKKMPDPN